MTTDDPREDPNVITVEHRTSATPDAVWRVLADGWLYAAWVVGASRVRDVDAGWPAVDTRIHHSVGLWPLLINDTTHVLAVTPREELVLTAKAWPVGVARVVITIEPVEGGCVIRMDEDASSGPGVLLPKLVRQALIAPRNREALRRLELLALGRS
jgi:hypothetical protein